MHPFMRLWKDDQKKVFFPKLISFSVSLKNAIDMAKKLSNIDFFFVLFEKKV